MQLEREMGFNKVQNKVCLFDFNKLEVIYIHIHLQSYPFKDIQPSYWLLLKILSSHWLRRVDIFKWITF